MIRDTSQQDAVIAPPAGYKLKRRALWIGSAVLVAALGVGLVSTWRGSEASVSAARLRIAEATRGTLVRDASVNGRVVAAGDTVKKGQVLAVLESPDLADVLKRETSAYDGLKAEVARQQILSRKQKLLAQKDADTAEIDRLSAQRTLERYDSVGQVGIIAKNDYQNAQGGHFQFRRANSMTPSPSLFRWCSSMNFEGKAQGRSIF